MKHWEKNEIWCIFHWKNGTWYFEKKEMENKWLWSLTKKRIYSKNKKQIIMILLTKNLLKHWEKKWNLMYILLKKWYWIFWKRRNGNKKWLWLLTWEENLLKREEKKNKFMMYISLKDTWYFGKEKKEVKNKKEVEKNAIYTFF